MRTLLTTPRTYGPSQSPPTPTTVVLISCSKSKLTTSAPARELYTGQLFKKALAWAERNEFRWFIVSALHGLLTPNQIVQPYDFTIQDLRGAVEREQWAHKVVGCELTRYACASSKAILLLPKLYRRLIEEQLRLNHITYENPVEGLGIGQQMKWLAEN